MSNNSAAAQVSLKLIVRSSILSEIKKKLEGTPHLSSGTVLVTDEDGDRILADCACTVDEMMSVGVLTKESLFAKRNPRPSTAVIYFVSPKLAVASKIVEDFHSNLYSAIYIFLTEDNDEFYDPLQPAGQNIAACVAFAFSFTPLESRVFTINKPESIFQVWMADDEEGLDSVISEYADKFRDVLTTMNTEPVIRYHDPYGTGKTIAARTAIALKDRMDEYKSENSEFPAPSPYDHLGPATVVVVDRSFDLVAPLLHTLSYQALAHDTLKIVDEVDVAKNLKHLIWKTPSSDTSDSENAQESVKMDESSSLFNTLRHLFILLAIEEVTAAKNSIAQFVTEKSTSTDDIRLKLHQASDVNAQTSQLGAVQVLIQTMMANVDERNLEPVTVIEQRIAVGKNEDGALLTRKKAVDQMRRLIKDYEIEKQDKLRIFLVFTLAFGGVSETDFTSLWKDALLDETDAILFRGLDFFGIDATQAVELSEARDASSWNIASIFKRGVEATKEDDMKQYDLYEPKIAKLLRDQINGRLDTRGEFKLAKGKMDGKKKSAKGYVGTIRRADLDDGQIGASGQVGRRILLDFKSEFVPSWGRARPKAEGDLGGDYRANGARTIIMMVGGLSYAEIRAVYLTGMKAERETYIGSTHMITPNEFVESLSQLGEMNAVPYDFLHRNIPAEVPFAILDDVGSPPTIARPIESALANEPDVSLNVDTGDDDFEKPLPPPPDVSTPSVVDNHANMTDSRANSFAPPFHTGSYRGPSIGSSQLDPPVSSYQTLPTQLQQPAIEQAKKSSSRPSSIISYESFGAVSNPRESSLRNSSSTNSRTVENYHSSVPAHPQPQSSLPPSTSFQSRGSSMNSNKSSATQQPMLQPTIQPPPLQNAPSDSVSRLSSVISQDYQSSHVIVAAESAPAVNVTTAGPSDPPLSSSEVGFILPRARPSATVNELLALSSQNMALAEQVAAVMEMAPPEYSKQVIEADLKFTGTVEVTIERIFCGVLPPQEMQYPTRQSTVVVQDMHNATTGLGRNKSVASMNSFASGDSTSFITGTSGSATASGAGSNAPLPLQSAPTYKQPYFQQEQQSTATTQSYYIEPHHNQPSSYPGASQQPPSQEGQQFTPIHKPTPTSSQSASANTNPVYRHSVNEYNQQYVLPPIISDSGRTLSKNSQRSSWFSGSFFQLHQPEQVQQQQPQPQQQQQNQNSRPQSMQHQPTHSKTDAHFEESQLSSTESVKSSRFSTFGLVQSPTQQPAMLQQQQQPQQQAGTSTSPSSVLPASDPFPGWTGDWPLALTKDHQRYQKEKQAYIRSLER
ncbi:hypothetical protein HDU77_002527 [Chytriomyces hyalinus]|nr:hypothetical protein HDU77_002527 [Chytriomyces hyalinus]